MGETELQCLEFKSAKLAIEEFHSKFEVGQSPVVAILNHNIDRPEQHARQLHMEFPSTRIIFLCEDGSEKLVGLLKKPSAAIGQLWDVIDISHAQAPKKLLAILQSAVKKQKFKTTLNRLQTKITRADKLFGSDLQRHSTSLQFLSHMVENAQDAIIATTLDAIIVKWNQSAEKQFDLIADQAIGRSIFSLCNESWAKALEANYASLIGSGENIKDLEVELLAEDGTRSTLSLTLSLIRNENQEEIGVTLFVRDITERKLTEAILDSMRKDLERMSYEDGLTGIANRRMLDKSLEQEWSRAIRHGYSVSLILIDIDYFKHYNDSYGHIAGDECLIKVAKILSSCAQRSSDLVSRYGGEEFAILSVLMNQDKIQQLAQRCLDAIASAKIPHKSSCGGYLSISLGTASLIPRQSDSISKLLQLADERLYKAKRAGRNRIVGA